MREPAAEHVPCIVERRVSGRSRARPFTFDELNRSVATSASTVHQERIAMPRLASTNALMT
jgi:hypothetical protein